MVGLSTVLDHSVKYDEEGNTHEGKHDRVACVEGILLDKIVQGC